MKLQADFPTACRKVLPFSQNLQKTKFTQALHYFSETELLSFLESVAATSLGVIEPCAPVIEGKRIFVFKYSQFLFIP